MDSYSGKVGDRIRVRIKGARRGSTDKDDAGRLATTTITEASDSQWNHYVYLASSSVTDNTVYGGGVDVEFDAEITGEPRTSPAITTQVNELVNGKTIGPAHFIYLGSPYVTKLPDEPKRVPVTRENGTPGTNIRVRLSGLASGSKYAETNGTTRVNTSSYSHLIYLGGMVSQDGDTVTAEFDARITGAYGDSTLATTAVEEITPGGGIGFTHYLLLADEGISLLEPEPGETISLEQASAEPAEAVLAEAVQTPKRTIEKGDTMSIDRYDETITYREVRDRIEELELDTETTYSVVRERNGEVLADSYDDEDDARQFIEDNDYNPERVIVRETEPDAEDTEELEMLGVLNLDCESEFGRSWRDGDVMLRREDYFDSDWARDEAVATLGVNSGDLDAWPLSLVDWDEARDQRLENDYSCVPFDGTEYYGQNY
jgi:hypothetical protein